MSRYQQLIDDWRTAEKRAQEAEAAMGAAFDRFLERRGPAPSESERAAVQRLRAEATEKLARAIEYLQPTKPGG